MSRYLVAFLPGSAIPTRIKYIDDATGPPDADVDAATDGVAIGSIVIDTTNHKAYLCESAATGAALWIDLTGGGTELSTLLVDLSVTGANDVDRNDAATHDLTLTGNTTLTPIHSDPPTGEAVDLRVIVRQDGTGGWTLAFGGTIDWAGGSAPTMPSGANDLITLGFLSLDDGATWLGYGGSGGADLSGIDFLVGTASGLLSGEIVVGTTPGGELGGTWGTPTVDATHSGSTHAGTQAAAEATAAAALSAHTGDTSDAHDASAVSIVDAGLFFTGTDVEAALQELAAGGGATEAFIRDIGHWEVVVSGTGPPVAVSTPADDDWVYAWVPG